MERADDMANCVGAALGLSDFIRWEGAESVGEGQPTLVAR